MKPPKKVRADAKLKNLSEEEQEQLWRWMQTPTGEGEERALPTLDDAQAHVPLMFGFTISVSQLSEWRAWYALNLRMASAAERAEQTRLELIKNSDLTPEDIERVAQTVFTAETLQGGDVEHYVKLAKLRLTANKLDLDRRKLALLEAKAAKADAAEEVAGDAKLTAEEKQARLKQIFGMG